MQNNEEIVRKSEKPEPMSWPGVVAFGVFMVCVTAVIVAWIVWGS